MRFLQNPWCICLVTSGAPDSFVRAKRTPKPPAQIEFCGRTYLLTRKRTAGNWPVYVVG